MRDTWVHKDCSSGKCPACCIEETMARFRSGYRAWFNPDATTIATIEETTRMRIEEAVRATLPKVPK